jgi:hypothetical protein
LVALSTDAGPLKSVVVYVEGVRVYEHALYTSPRVWFARPEYFGEAQYSEAVHTVEIVPRRPYAKGVARVVTVVAEDSAGGATFEETFYTADAVPPTTASVFATSATLPPGLTALAGQLRGALSRPGVPFADVLLYAVKRSQLLPVLLELVPALTDVSGEVEDPASTLSADVALRAVDVAWEPAREELAVLGWQPPDLDVFAKALAAQYPQERVGAACGMVLLAYATA